MSRLNMDPHSIRAISSNLCRIIIASKSNTKWWRRRYFEKQSKILLKLFFNEANSNIDASSFFCITRDGPSYNLVPRARITLVPLDKGNVDSGNEIGFRAAVPAKQEYFCVALITTGESSSWQELLESEKKIRGNHAFSRDHQASIWEKIPYIV